MKEYKVRICDQSGQIVRLVFQVPLIGRTTWQVIDPGKLSVGGGTVEMVRPKAYVARERELEARKDAWRAAEIAKADKPTQSPLAFSKIPTSAIPIPMPAIGLNSTPTVDPLAVIASRIVPAPSMTSAPAPDWMNAELKVDDCLWRSFSHMQHSHPNYGTAIALADFLNKQFIVDMTRTGAGLVYQKYARGLRPGLIKWEIEGAPCRLRLADDFQSWPSASAVNLAKRMAADLPHSAMFR
jgi:hypothetical protein